MGITQGSLMSSLYERIRQFNGGINKSLPHIPYARMTAVLKKDVKGSRWDPKTREDTDYIIKAGTKVRVWTTSRFGWVGIAPDDEKVLGYDACLGGHENQANPGAAEDYLTDVWVKLD